jgi:hypothetical protein
METLRQYLVLGFRLGMLQSEKTPSRPLPAYLTSKSVAFTKSYMIGLHLANMLLIEASCKGTGGDIHRIGSEILERISEEIDWLERFSIKADLKFPELTPFDFQILRTGLRRIFKATKADLAKSSIIPDTCNALLSFLEQDSNGVRLGREARLRIHLISFVVAMAPGFMIAMLIWPVIPDVIDFLSHQFPKASDRSVYEIIVGAPLIWYLLKIPIRVFEWTRKFLSEREIATIALGKSESRA